MSVTHDAQTKRLVIVGGGQVAATLLTQLNKFKSDLEITLVSAEDSLPVNRPLLSKDYLCGKAAEDQLALIAPERLSNLNLTVQLSTRVTSIDRQSQTLTLDSGEQRAWDFLVLATGAPVRKLSIPGADLDGVHYLKTRADADVIRSQLKPGSQLTVIGGGYIGLEIAASARQLGVKVRLLETGERILRRVVAPEVSRWFSDLHQSEGVEVLTNSSVSRLLGDANGGLNAVELTGGEQLQTDVLVAGIGVIPDVALAEQADIDCMPNGSCGGIQVNQYCQTNDAHIYAAGDIACRIHPFYAQPIRLESIESAQHQAQIIAAHLCDQPIPETGVPWFWSTQFGQKLQIAGLATLPGFRYDQLVVRRSAEEGKPSISWLYLKEGRLLACDALGRPGDFLHAKKLIAKESLVDIERLSDASVPLSKCVLASENGLKATG